MSTKDFLVKGTFEEASGQLIMTRQGGDTFPLAIIQQVDIAQENKLALDFCPGAPKLYEVSSTAEMNALDADELSLVSVNGTIYVGNGTEWVPFGAALSSNALEVPFWDPNASFYTKDSVVSKDGVWYAANSMTNTTPPGAAWTIITLGDLFCTPQPPCFTFVGQPWVNQGNDNKGGVYSTSFGDMFMTVDFSSPTTLRRYDMAGVGVAAAPLVISTSNNTGAFQRSLTIIDDEVWLGGNSGYRINSFRTSDLVYTGYKDLHQGINGISGLAYNPELDHLYVLSSNGNGYADEFKIFHFASNSWMGNQSFTRYADYDSTVAFINGNVVVATGNHVITFDGEGPGILEDVTQPGNNNAMYTIASWGSEEYCVAKPSDNYSQRNKVPCA